MKAQKLLSGVHSNPITPSSHIKTSTLISNPFYISRTPKWGSFKTRNVQSQQIAYSLKSPKCIASVDRHKHVTDMEEAVKPGVRRKKLAVFVSGGGSNFRSINQAIDDGTVYGDVVVLVTDKPGCGGADYARERGIPVILFPQTKANAKGISSTDLATALREFSIDFIILAGYLKLIPVDLIRAFPRSILNIHPSLLPAFGGKGYYGMKVHKAVIASGARFSGPTIHFVDEHYDTGSILAQRVVPVLASDTAEKLAARVLCEEHRIYVEVTTALCEDRIIFREDGVPLIRSKENPNEYS